MYKKGYRIASVILFPLSIVFGWVGVWLFRFIPLEAAEATIGQSLILVGIVFAFIFAVLSLGLAIGFLIASLNSHYHY